MPTRLNAILLIPVVVGLVMGGFQVKSSIDTWQQAEDAENTARLVRAALTYGNELLVERDVTAAPLLQGKGQNDKDGRRRRASTPTPPRTPSTRRPRTCRASPAWSAGWRVFREVEPDLQTPCARPPTPNASPV